MASRSEITPKTGTEGKVIPIQYVLKREILHSNTIVILSDENEEIGSYKSDLFYTIAKKASNSSISWVEASRSSVMKK
ncbi:jg19833 [Pararge aegeria aegeria]|uniref:Jg19833 protein n=1 Tax=Pararge aegeria aegeria TaxID=348720 RepID=A0A8S4SKV6_9NEOP|nr:jg19833 [Pararge aegeria aegeria]